MSTRPFPLALVEYGDRVQLMYTGDRAVSKRLSGEWAKCTRTAQHAQAWQVNARIDVEPLSEPDTTRRINVEQIRTVERRGVVIAQRRQSRDPAKPFPLIDIRGD